MDEPVSYKSTNVALHEIEKRTADFIAHMKFLGASRELSLAITKIEEAAMWAKQHVLTTG
jgi:hypothetical protein